MLGLKALALAVTKVRKLAVPIPTSLSQAACSVLESPTYLHSCGIDIYMHSTVYTHAGLGLI